LSPEMEARGPQLAQLDPKLYLLRRHALA
jgi:hypothetical protein